MPLYRQPKSSNWFVRFSIGGIKVRRSSGTTDRQAAHEFESKLRADLWRQFRLGERPRYTWREAVERWRAGAEGRDRDRDAERIAWFAEYLDHTPLAEITPELIEKLRALRAAEAARKFGGNGRSTANRYMALLRMVLRKARDEWDWLDRIPKVPMFKAEKREPRFLTRRQAKRLLEELVDLPHLAALAEFSLETGLRMRNATGLQWHQVDLKRRLLVVPAARAKAGDTIAVPLSARAVAILVSLRGEHDVYTFTFKRGPKGHALPFEDGNGAEFKAAAKRAGVPWLRWHDLRHTWASWHVQGGTPLHVLQELGGWKSYEMVKRYAHLTTEHLREYV